MKYSHDISDFTKINPRDKAQEIPILRMLIKAFMTIKKIFKNLHRYSLMETFPPLLQNVVPLLFAKRLTVTASVLSQDF
jgi:hypothetical protein